MAGAASAHQAATASREQNSQQRAVRTQRTSADPQRAQQVATAAAAAAPAALDSLSRLQQLADASPRVAQLRRLQALADGRFDPVAQLAGGPEEEELIQGQFATAELQPQLQQAPRANNTGLPDQLKSGIESLSGFSMDHVRVHFNSSQPAQLNALAYAQGSDIHLAPGQEQHLPHEAWHVVQQAQGRVRPTLQMKDGVPVNDDVGLEREADVMGERMSTVQRIASDAQLINTSTGLAERSTAVVQCLKIAGKDVSAQKIMELLGNIDKKQMGNMVKIMFKDNSNHEDDKAACEYLQDKLQIYQQRLERSEASRELGDMTEEVAARIIGGQVNRGKDGHDVEWRLIDRDLLNQVKRKQGIKLGNYTDKEIFEDWSEICKKNASAESPLDELNKIISTPIDAFSDTKIALAGGLSKFDGFDGMKLTSTARARVMQLLELAKKLGYQPVYVFNSLVTCEQAQKVADFYNIEVVHLEPR